MSSVPMWSVARAVSRHPPVWGEALRALPGLARRGWWRRPPFLPIPDGEYLGWRITTAYGDAGAPVLPDDVVAFLAWSKRQRRR